MESKKINQLATELAPDLSDLTIIGDPTTGISKKITLSQMASLFTGTVEEYANLAAFPLVGVADTIYIALDTNILYRWNTGTSAYVELSPNIVSSLVFNDANGFDGTINLVGSVATLTITTALTTGSVSFIGASGALLQDNANFFWDDTNNRLGLGTNSPTTALDVFGSGIIGRLNGTSTNNAFLGFASAGSNKWSIGNVQADHRFRIYNEATTSELVSVLSTGEFGIGIANPTTKFHIDGAASALIANLDANVSIAKSVSFRSDNSARINLEVSGTESGSNAGADFFLRTFTDAGSLLETPFTIVRSTGVTTIKSLTLTNVLSVANGGTGSATQNFVDLTSIQTAAGAKTFSAITTISNATASTSTTTGGLVVTGGVGIGGALFGTSATFSGLITGQSSIYQTNAAGNIASNRFGTYNGGSTQLFFDYPASGSVAFNNGTDKMVITSGGNVGIGETTPTEALQVNGSIRALQTNTTGIAQVAVDASNTTTLRCGLATFSASAAGTLIGVSRASNSFIYKSGGVLAIGTDAAYPFIFSTSDTERIRINGGNGYTIPGADNTYQLGQSGTRWSSVWAATGTIQTSDEREKKNIIDSDLGLDFIIKLRPVSFKWKIGQNIVTNELILDEEGNPILDEEGNKKTKSIITAREGKRIHYGLIAQEVETLLNGKDFGGFIYDEETDSKGLRYDQFIPLLIKAIQELKAEIDLLKAK